MAEGTTVPNGLYKGPSGTWLIDKVVRGKRIRRSTRTTDIGKAVALLDAETRMLDHRIYGNDWADAVDSMVQDQKSWLRRTAQSLAYRGKRHGKGCTLTLSQLEQLLHRSGGRCELTGIAFDMRRTEAGRSPPFHPSIDRVESGLGYTYQNCRVVCLAVNLCMREWGAEVIQKIGRAMIVRQLAAWEEEGRWQSAYPNLPHEKKPPRGGSL